jgi:hypothetical protein
MQLLCFSQFLKTGYIIALTKAAEKKLRNTISVPNAF